jgi:hypothetical protein
MAAAGFELAIPASEWPQTHALDWAATGVGHKVFMTKTIVSKVHISKLLFVFLIQLFQLSTATDDRLQK